MRLLLVGLGVLAAGGGASTLAGKSRVGIALCGAGGAVIGSVLGLMAAVRVLASGVSESVRGTWSVPGGSFHLELDPLSACFLVPLFALCAVAAVYAVGYLGEHVRRPHVFWAAFDLLAASMAIVVVARNAVLFLTAWEAIAILSFLLVTFHDERDEVRSAGRRYLIATHLSTAFLLAMFALLGEYSGSLEFDAFVVTPKGAAAIFVLGVVGFGTKAGLVPFHVWLPSAHPAAPSPVSAMMSGTMITMGLYGILRVLLLPGIRSDPRFGLALVALGALSAILGALQALAQSDLKRVLAYSTVENAGIVAMTLGLGAVCHARHMPLAGGLAFAAALLHVLNHALFKGLLFLAAGAVLHTAGTTELSRLGGLGRAMPRTSLAFLAGSASAAALPPTCGFVGEFLLALAAFSALGSASTLATGITVLVALAVASGLALSGGVRGYGIAFLGEPRDASVGPLHDPGPAMRWSMETLVALTIALGGMELLGVRWLGARIGELVPGEIALPPVARFAAGAWLVVATGLLAWAARRALGGRRTSSVPTWGCGYPAPTARMQYTAESFAQPILSLAGRSAGERRVLAAPVGPFPGSAELETRAVDPALAAYTLAFRAARVPASSLRWLQRGRVQLYVLYIVLTLLAVLAWVLVRLP